MRQSKHRAPVITLTMGRISSTVASLPEEWRGVLSGRPRTETLSVDDAGIMVMDDQAALVDRKFAEFIKGVGK